MKKKMPALIYSRVCGYYSPVQTAWNKGKQEEFKDRYDTLNHKFIYQDRRDDIKRI